MVWDEGRNEWSSLRRMFCIRPELRPRYLRKDHAAVPGLIARLYAWSQAGFPIQRVIPLHVTSSGIA